MTKSMSIADLLAKKEQLKKKKQATDLLYIESLGGNIRVQEPTGPICNETFEMAQDPTRSDKSDAYMVYNCVIEPNLKDKDLQKEFGCVEPTDIVDMIFKPGETASISTHCIHMAGYSSGLKKVDAELKN
jgi:hypothetical protein